MGEDKTAGSSLDWSKTALIIIGMQNDYVDETKQFALKGAAAIVPTVSRTVSFARERGALIVWVTREHHISGRDVELFRRRVYMGDGVGPVIKGTEGAALVSQLQPQPNDHRLVKSRFSAFFGTNLHSVLRAAGIENVIVIGIQTSCCIRQTAFDAVAHDFQRVLVISDATLALTPEAQKANLEDMRGVRIATPTLEELMQGRNCEFKKWSY